MDELGHAFAMSEDRLFRLDWEGPDPSREGRRPEWSRSWVLSIDGEPVDKLHCPIKTTHERLTGWLRTHEQLQEDVVQTLADKVLEHLPNKGHDG